MPSDDRAGQVLGALAESREAFRGVIEATVAEVRAYLVASHDASEDRDARAAAELGAFGNERLHAGQFAALFAEPATLDRVTTESVEKAFATLTALAGREDDLFLVNVSPGQDLRQRVAAALAEIGRVFGAAHIVERIRSGRYHYGQHGRDLGAFPFARWTRTERRLVPPLVVALDGRDLAAMELAEFLDGAMKLVLVVRGEAAPAPLVRLITPHTYVIQATETAELRGLYGWEGPGAAALMPESAARFVHDPRAGADLWSRLTVSYMPRGEPRKALGNVSAAQQAEELFQLRALTDRPAVAPPATVEGVATEGAPSVKPAPADRLAAWLLSQADLQDLEA